MSEESSNVSNDETYSDNFTDIVGLDFLSVSGFDDETISCPDHENIPNYLKSAYMQIKKSNNELLSDINLQFQRYKYVSKAEKTRKFKYPCKFTDMNGKACTSYTNNDTHLCAVHENKSYSVCKLQCIYDSNDLNAITSNTGRCDGRTLSSYGLCKRHANCTYYRERQLYDKDWIHFIMMRQPLYILRHYCLIKFDNEKKEYKRIEKFKNLQNSAKSIAHDLGIYDTLINNCEGGYIIISPPKEIAEDITEVKTGEHATECE
jgi:hypothetical protein